MSFDDSVRRAVHDLADEARPGRPLTAGAVVIGRRIRRRRRWMGVLAAAVAFAAMAAPFLVRASLAPSGLPLPTPSAVASRSTGSPTAAPYPRSTGETTLPRADGTPGAADRPDLVGTEPGVVHFDVRLSVVPGLIGSRWSTGPGEESAYLAYDAQGDASRDIAITINRGEPADPLLPGATSTTVRGRPAMLASNPGPDSVPPSPPTWRLVWHPVDGLAVTIVARDRTDTVLRAVAETLRLDVAQYLAQPFRTTTLPRGYTLVAVHIGISAQPGSGGARFADRLGVWWYSGAAFTTGRGSQVSVTIEPLFRKDPASAKDAFRPNRTVGGRPAMWVPPGTASGLSENTLEIEGFHQWFDLYITGAPEAEATAIAIGLQLHGNTARPSTWPPRIA